MSNNDTKQIILISLQVQEFQTILIDCVNACLKQNQIQSQSRTNGEELLTVPQAAEFLTLSVPTIYGLLHRKELPSMKRAKRVYFKRSELMQYLEQGRKKTIAEIETEAHCSIVSNKRSRK